jgi:hypothetical protein
VSEKNRNREQQQQTNLELSRLIIGLNEIQNQKNNLNRCVDHEVNDKKTAVIQVNALMENIYNLVTILRFAFIEIKFQIIK